MIWIIFSIGIIIGVVLGFIGACYVIGNHIKQIIWIDGSMTPTPVKKSWAVIQHENRFGSIEHPIDYPEVPKK